MKWTLTNAGIEFGVSRETLRKQLTVAEIPKKDTYSTKEICRAVFGDIENERLRLCREQADKLALDNEQSRQQLVPLSELLPKLEQYVAAARARIDGDPKLDRDEKDKIMRDIARVGTVAIGCGPGPGSGDDAAAAV